VSVLFLAVLVPATPALADGDPASDVLASQSVFLPSDGGIPVAQQQRLAALLQSAQRAGYPVRVALIATKSDLGSISELWRQPAGYAHFLSQELALVYKGTVLVVMPNGFGVAVGGKPLTFAGAPPAPTSGGATLATAAVSAVQHLSASAGHTLALPPPPPASSAPAGARGGSTDVGAWAAIAIGVLLIGAAWGASLRARPFGSRRATET
jgi:hypothetical protein